MNDGINKYNISSKIVCKWFKSQYFLAFNMDTDLSQGIVPCFLEKKTNACLEKINLLLFLFLLNFLNPNIFLPSHRLHKSGMSNNWEFFGTGQSKSHPIITWLQKLPLKNLIFIEIINAFTILVFNS